MGVVEDRSNGGHDQSGAPESDIEPEHLVANITMEEHANANDDDDNDNGAVEVAPLDDTDDSVSDTAHKEKKEDPNRPLTRREALNLVFSLLAWACTICNVTLGKSKSSTASHGTTASHGASLVYLPSKIAYLLTYRFYFVYTVVGTGAVVMLSIGGDDNSTSIPLGAYFFGASLISFTVTPWLFTVAGRKLGFLVGIGWGMIGTATGAASIATESPPLLIVSSAFFGAAAGIGFFLRYAAVEVAPPQYAARAVTLVVSGGCIAAFAGPESARATKMMFGDDLEYMGVFLMTGIFNVANIVFTCLVQFPVAPVLVPPSRSELLAVVKTRHFLTPMLVVTMCWAMMAVPMSLVRVAMGQVGFTSRQSLTTIELHFLGMYGPGFFTGSLIQKWGPRAICAGALSLYVIGLSFLLTSKEEEGGSIATWIPGMVFLGMGWNLGFTAGTIWLAEIYKSRLHLKTAVQSTNDCLMFGLAGVWIFSASYIFDAGGSGLDGWKTLNFVVVGMLALTTCIVGNNYYWERSAIEQGGDQNELTVADKTPPELSAA